MSPTSQLSEVEQSLSPEAVQTTLSDAEQRPLSPDMEEWEEFLEGRYKEGKSQEEFRQYDEQANPGVAEFFGLKRGEKSIWEAAEYLNTLVDDSDPDTDLTQLEHLLQTSEAIRRDGHPRWMVATGFVHDLGKCLCLYGEPQWGVVGDTFPTGCAYSDQVVFPEYFRANPDYNNPTFQTKYGIYEPNCGLDKVKMSFGHDGYIYEVMKNYLPMEALYMLRFHSFYAWHRHGAYDHLCNEQDRAMLPWVLKFNPYDLYSKGHTKPNLKELKPYYDDLFAEFFPAKIAW